MLKQVIFLLILLITIGVFTYSILRYSRFFKFTKKKLIKDIPKRIWLTIKIAIFQEKILRKPIVGLMHAIVWWGFILILFGSIEMVIDGLFGTERILIFLGPIYDIIMAAGDISAFAISLIIIAFLIRRLTMHIKRFYGPEMKSVSKMDKLFGVCRILPSKGFPAPWAGWRAWRKLKIMR